MKLTITQLRKIIKEEVEAMMPTGGKDPQRFLHGFESGHPMDDEGYMVKSRMSDVKEMAETICDLLEMGDQLPAWVQDLVASAHTDLEHVKDYLVGDEKMRAYNKPSVSMSMGESKRRSSKILSEGHAPITQSELEQWKSGNWGFVFEADEEQPSVWSIKCQNPDCGKTYEPASKDIPDESGYLVATCPHCDFDNPINAEKL